MIPLEPTGSPPQSHASRLTTAGSGEPGETSSEEETLLDASAGDFSELLSSQDEADQHVVPPMVEADVGMTASLGRADASPSEAIRSGAGLFEEKTTGVADELGTRAASTEKVGSAVNHVLPDAAPTAPTAAPPPSRVLPPADPAKAQAPLSLDVRPPNTVSSSPDASGQVALDQGESAQTKGTQASIVAATTALANARPVSTQLQPLSTGQIEAPEDPISKPDAAPPERAATQSLTPKLPQTVTTGPTATPMPSVPPLIDLKGVDHFEFAPGQADSSIARAAASAPHSPLVTTALAQDPRVIVNQVTAQVVKGQSGVLDIRLDPPELGRVSLTLSPGDDNITAVIASERPETHDFLRRHADMLQRALREAGYSEVKLDFSASGDNGADANGGGERLSSPAPSEQIATKTAAPDASYSLKVALNGLDIRL